MQRYDMSRALFALAAIGGGTALADTTVSFQQGVNGYTGTYNSYISTSAPDQAASAVATKVNMPLDGLDASNPANSPDTVGLLRYDNIFGNGPGQIPVGAYILSANLTLTTYTSSSANSGGPWGVAALTQPFSGSTTYNSYVQNAADPIGSGGNVGPWYTTGTATRAVGGIGKQTQSQVVSVNVAPFVQSWSSGALANNGLVIQSGFTGTTDGWSVDSASNATAANRPQLSVTYTTDPVHVATLQQGVNGYSGTRMTYMQSFQGVDQTSDGSTIAQNFLDQEDASSIGSSAAIQFTDIASAANIPATAVIRSAYLVITTGEASGNARSGSEWRLDASPIAWDASTGASTFPTFDVNGPAGTELSSVTGMVTGSQAWFDVTAYVQAVLDGTIVDNGWLLHSAGGGDGWQIDFTGADDASTRPQLVVAYTVPEPASFAAIGLAGLALMRRRRSRQ
ncbi:MAG: DNRLRE domain-containing protein [Tepidisphaeraceae bacterium]